jgi:hypothetical protein
MPSNNPIKQTVRPGNKPAEANGHVVYRSFAELT